MEDGLESGYLKKPRKWEDNIKMNVYVYGEGTRNELQFVGKVTVAGLVTSGVE
jgi:hypothetical protein